jgi:hypothetical protein
MSPIRSVPCHDQGYGRRRYLTPLPTGLVLKQFAGVEHETIGDRVKDKVRLQWLLMEHHRLHIVEEWPDGSYKEATLAAIHSTIERAGQNSRAPIGVPECIICGLHAARVGHGWQAGRPAEIVAASQRGSD